jgi:hypothetical protein
MTLFQVTTAFGFAFKSFGGLFGFNEKKGDKLSHYSMIAVGAIIFFVILFYAYQWYVVSREQTVQKIFSEQVIEFKKAHSPEQLESMVVDCKSGHDQYASSRLAPYFTAYEVDALLKLGNKTEALASLDGLIASLSSSNPLIHLFKTKRALLKFDIDDAATQKAGLKELQQLAQDVHNKDQDLAQFYLGLYYYGTDDLANAKKVWQDLIELSLDSKNPSPWAEQAKQRLESLA